MTERLTQLLHDEADRLDVPPVAVEPAMTRGRSLHRRRTVAMAGAAVAVVAVIGGVALVATGGDDGRAADPAGGSAATTANVPAFGTGSTVYLGDRTATVPDTVHSLHYTSAGVLVRSNPNDGASDGSGPEALTLATYDGSTVDLGTIPEGVGPATDPDEAIYVLAEARGDGFVAVVRDATTGETVKEVSLPDMPPSYWPVPPLALDGNDLYVGYRSQTAVVDLTTGDSHVVEGMEGGAPNVYGGHAVTNDDKSVSVTDAATGQVLFSMETKSYAYGSLSPDGRYLRVSEMDGTSIENTVTIYDVATGRAVDLGPLASAADPGWTAAGDAFAVEDGTLTTCNLGSGECSTLQVPVGPDADVRMGGQVYES